MNFFPSRALDRQGDLSRQAIGMAMANRQAAQQPAMQLRPAHVPLDVGFATTMDYLADPTERANQERARQQNPGPRGPMGPAMYDPSPGRPLSAFTPERTMEYREPGGGSQLKQLGEPMPMPAPFRPMPSMSDMMTNMYGYGMSPFAGRGMGRMGGYGRQPMMPMFGGYGRQPMMPMFGGYGRQPMMSNMFGGNYGRTPIQPPMMGGGYDFNPDGRVFAGGSPIQPGRQPMQTMDMPRQQVAYEPASPPSLPQYAAQLYGGFTPMNMQ